MASYNTTALNIPRINTATVTGPMPKVKTTSMVGQTPTVTAQQTTGQTPTVDWQSITGDVPTARAQKFGDVSSLGGMIPRSIDNIGGPGGSIDDYMNPYLDAVMGDGLSELRRQHELTRQARAGGAHMAGAFGDARHGVAEAESERHLQDTSQRFINQVLGQGYDNAMGLRQNDINRIMQAGQFDIGNEFNSRQIDVSNAFQASLANAGFEMQALSQDQQAALQAGMANANNLIGQMQGDANRALQAGLASAGFRMEALSADQQARLQESMTNASNQIQRQLANQQARQDTRFFNTGNVVNAQQSDAERSLRKFLSGPGMQGQEISNDLSIINAMLGIGDRQQSQQQQSASLAYQDFLRQQGWDEKQVAFMSNILTSMIPGAGQTTTQTSQQGSDPLGMALSLASLIPLI